MLASGVAEIASVVSATEAHSQGNARRSRDQAIADTVGYAGLGPRRGAGGQNRPGTRDCGLIGPKWTQIGLMAINARLTEVS